MTPRQAIIDAIGHKEVRPVPYTFGFDPAVGEAIDAHYGDDAWRKRLIPYIQSFGVVNVMARELIDEDKRLYRDPFGGLWRHGVPMHLEKPPLAEATLKGYALPPVEKFFCDAAHCENSRQAMTQHADAFRVGCVYWGLFEQLWAFRGFENALYDMAADEGFVVELLDYLTDLYVRLVDFTCEQLPDLDAIMFGDDWGDQRGLIMGPDRWRRLFKPRWAKIYDRCHHHGKTVITHCCGSIVDVLEDAIEIGLDVWESVQPEARDMNPYALKKRFGDRLTFWGCLGCQGTLQFAAPDKVREEIMKLKREMGAGGGYILAPAKPLPEGMPTANAVAAFEAFVTPE